MTQKDSKTRKNPNNTRSQRSGGSAQGNVRRASGEPMSGDEIRRAKNIERNRKRRRNRIIRYALAIAAVVAAAVILSLTVFFKIETVAVAGDEIYNNEQIITASGLQTGDNMFLFDKDSVEANIETALPYVENAEIKRSVTGTLTINITAAAASLSIDTGDGYILLNSSGKVLEDGVMVINEGITVLRTSTVLSASAGGIIQFENEKDIETVVQIKNYINEYEIPKISEIDVTDYSNIRLIYDNRIVLKTGVPSELGDKIDFIKATLEKHEAQEPAFRGTIDFTVENKAYINPEDETTAPAAQPAVQPDTQPAVQPDTPPAAA